VQGAGQRVGECEHGGGGLGGGDLAEVDDAGGDLVRWGGVGVGVGVG